MAPEEKSQEDDNRTIRDVKTGISMKFNSPEDKEAFMKRCVREIAIKEEGYKCGFCAAFPCFRGYKEENPAGCCFQATRRCRQECSQYKYPEFPAEGGICTLDNTNVNYEQNCHIPKIKKTM